MICSLAENAPSLPRARAASGSPSRSGCGEEGCAVAIRGRHRATLATALGRLAARGIRAIVGSLDIADLAAFARLDHDAIQELGGLDIMWRTPCAHGRLG